VRVVARQQIDLLPPGPTEQELGTERHIVLLEIEDPVRTRIIDWWWETPNAYQFTAQVVLEIAKRLAGAGYEGWLTPGAILGLEKFHLVDGPKYSDALRDCRLHDRLAWAAR
jgi:hypothetical protein